MWRLDSDKSSASAKSKTKSQIKSDKEKVWLPQTDIELAFSGSTARVNLKPQSKHIQVLICRAVNLGERYIFLGPPGDDEIAIGEVPDMTTPFSVTGLHSIAFLALVAAAQQLDYTEDGDIYDRLWTGSEESYVKPLRSHVCGVMIVLMLLNYFFHRLGLAQGEALMKISAALPSVIKLELGQGQQRTDQVASW